LDECIEKATPNLSKIKDVDKELAEIRGHVSGTLLQEVNEYAHQLSLHEGEYYPREFVEWIGRGYMANSSGTHWVLRYADQRDGANWKTTTALYAHWKITHYEDWQSEVNTK
jgi:hypothetical protein